MRVGRPVIIFALVAGWVAALAVTLGGLIEPRAEPRGEVDEVIRRLQDTFIGAEDLTDEQLWKAAIEGIIDSLDDPYTSYLSPEQFQRFTDSLEGGDSEFEGIGAEVTARGGQIMILWPLPGSPARRAGVQAGDVILAVDGQSIEGMSLFEVVTLIRGPKGTEVVLRLRPAGSIRSVDVPVVRDTIVVTTTSARIHDGDVGYIRLDRFDKGVLERLPEAIAELRADGARGLLLDLRGNTGGLVETAIAVVSEFVEEGLVFRSRNADGTEEENEVTGEGTAYDLPLVVLVDGFSASASEIVAGALQDHGRATVVGSRTFGKGSVNLLSELASGSGLYVTTARWLTPNGRPIEGIGLEPDILVGSSADVQALQRLGQLTQSLCEGFAEDGAELRERPALAAAIESLCNVRQQPVVPPEQDAAFDAGVEELRRLMGA
ncbi:MAG: S41 family peptidase [Chloroflexi bacterium]|nr:S41 family peptidase [Chloroflexota bacterium]